MRDSQLVSGSGRPGLRNPTLNTYWQCDPGQLTSQCPKQLTLSCRTVTEILLVEEFSSPRILYTDEITGPQQKENYFHKIVD